LYRLVDQFHPAENACEENKRAGIECRECFEQCANMQLQKPHMFPKCVVRKTGNRGFGYFAGDKSIPNGTAIGPYTGQVMTAQELPEKQVYIMRLTNELFIDATDIGFWTRFMNHACNPNCIVKQLYVGGLPCIGIFALCDIAPGEELTFNYGVNFGDSKAFVCMCPTCAPLAAAASLP